MRTIETTTGEEVTVSALGHDAVAVSVRCPEFGGISRVRMTHDQAAALVGALSGIVLETAASRLAADFD